MVLIIITQFSFTRVPRKITQSPNHRSTRGTYSVLYGRSINARSTFDSYLKFYRGKCRGAEGSVCRVPEDLRDGYRDKTGRKTSRNLLLYVSVII